MTINGLFRINVTVYARELGFSLSILIMPFSSNDSNIFHVFFGDENFPLMTIILI
ncbi:MAG TPA: hypothetical protein VF242_08610 [Nitrososphaeraceae archaeon]